MSSISSVSNSTTSTASALDTTPNPSQTLNQNDFLKLLVSQIQYQDPMNPKSDTDMASQMAQFTTLQQASQSTTSLAMLQANSLLGSTVTVPADLQNPTAGTINGVVSGVVMNNGTPQITVGTNTYTLSQVLAVLPTVTQTNPTTN